MRGDLLKNVDSQLPTQECGLLGCASDATLPDSRAGKLAGAELSGERRT